MTLLVSQVIGKYEFIKPPCNITCVLLEMVLQINQLCLYSFIKASQYNYSYYILYVIQAMHAYIYDPLIYLLLY